MKFVGREKELENIKEKLSSKKAELIILYGRRRLGKSTLLKESIKDYKNSTYFQFSQENAIKNLIYFSNMLRKNFNDERFENNKRENWFEYFYLIRDLIPENYIFVLDEFPYLIETDKTIISQFQKIYDEILKSKNCKLVLCGSSSSIMTDLLEYKSPLYGRRTLSIELKEFSLSEVKIFLNNINNLEELIKYVFIFGGIPYYLEQINQDLSFEENFKNLFFDGKSFFHDEIIFLLKEEVREVRNYLAILKAIGTGKNKFNEIENDSLIEKSSLSKYIQTLEIIGLVKQHKSFFSKNKKPKVDKKIFNFIDNFF
jgi:hypothetical protein